MTVMDTDVTIRPLRVEDSSVMVDVLGSEKLYTHIGGGPPTHEELEARYMRQTVGVSPDGTQEWLNWIVLVGTSTMVGYVQASRPMNGTTAEIAWVIGVKWQRQGRATPAVRLMLEKLAARGVEDITADIHPANKASEGVARRVGMSPTGEVVDGETRWMGRARPADIA